MRSMPLPVPLALVMAGAAFALATDVPALPALRCPTDATEDQCLQHSSTEFTVEGCELHIAYDGDNILRLQCHNSLQLDSVRAFLPQFTPALHVGNVILTDCRPAYYATVLTALNVTPTSPFNLKLYDTKQTLTATHFVDLPPLLHLTLQDKGVLHDLPASLEVLTLEDMKIPDNILEALPRTLTELRMEAVNTTRIPAAVLDLPELRSLRMATEPAKIKEVVVERSNVSRLQHLYLAGADVTLLSEWAPPALEEANLWYWQPATPNPLPTCEKLVKLTLYFRKTSSLPARWVARCPRLELLHITLMHSVSELPVKLLENATQLTNFRIHGTSMSSLPAQLFTDTPHLTHLDLRYNAIAQLPPRIFADTPDLTHIELSYNQIDELPPQVFSGNPHLTHLNLEFNYLTELQPNLFADNPQLTSLDISSNRLTGLPPQIFAKTPHLTQLNLRSNRLSQLPSAILTLPLLSLDLGFNEFETSVVTEVASTFTELRNLSLAWNREIGDLCELNVISMPGRSPLASLLKLERLELQRTGISLICWDWREDMVNLTYLDLSDTKLGNLTYRDLRYKRSVPAVVMLSGPVHFTAHDYDRAAAAAAGAPPAREVTVLDLRNNSISYMTETTAVALVSGTKRRVLLAGNRLECSCRAAPALRVLRDHAAVLVEYDKLRCEDGGSLKDAVDACSTSARR